MRRELQHAVATIGLSATLLLPGVAASASLHEFTDQESATALREALVVGARRAVETLSRRNGYLGDPQVKIPLPSKFTRVERALRSVGMGKQVDDELMERFLPLVKRATAQVKVAESYNKFAGSAASFGLIDKKSADLDSYITQKALDGLFLKMAEEEKAIRKDPVHAGTDIVKRVFGAMRLQ